MILALALSKKKIQAHSLKVIENNHGLPKVRFVVCLDSVGLGSTLRMHVSKPPKEGSPSHKFLTDLQKVSSLLNPEVSRIKI